MMSSMLKAAVALACAACITASPIRYPEEEALKGYDTAYDPRFEFPADTDQTLLPRAYTKLKTGAITPKGWLLKQIKLQAEGLSGHLAMFWEDISASIWIGGHGDGGLHERAPYWLNGIVPMASLLQNAGEELLQNIDPPVNITAQAWKYIDAMRSSQDAKGWLGPVDNPKDGNTYWGRSNVMLSFAMFAEANPSEWDNVTKVMLNYALEQNRRMKDPAFAKLEGWAAARWMDMALAAEWLLDNAPQGKQAELWEYLTALHDQGSNWEQWFETFTGNAGGHNVNNAQAIKSSGVWYRANKSEALHQLSKSRMVNLDKRVGLPTGMFNGDEIIPNPPTRSPSRGIELCGVVEAMFSYNTLFSVHGDVEFADRAEKIAHNALPATWASPIGGDMWAHQYLQAINEINAINARDHVWTHDGPAAEMYGLEPNYGCCTANFNQGWPKYASMVVYSTSDNGGAVGIWAPVKAELPNGATVDITTDYPFEDTATVTVTAKSAMPLYLRIPGWAKGTTVNGKPAKEGTMAKFACAAGVTKFSVVFTPEIKLERWGDGDNTTMPYSVLRGSLLFSLPIDGNYTVTAHHYGSATQSNDYEVRPNSPWQFALVADPSDPAKSFTLNRPGYVEGAAPFNHTLWPLTLSATLKPLTSWGTAHSSAAPPPDSPACAKGTCAAPIKVTLVPHGGTDLRIGEFPLAE